MKQNFRYVNSYFLNSNGYNCNSIETPCRPGYYGVGEDDPFVSKPQCAQEGNVFWPQCTLDVSKIKTEVQARAMQRDFGSLSALHTKYCADNPTNKLCTFDTASWIKRWLIVNVFLVIILLITIWMIISNKPCKPIPPQASLLASPPVSTQIEAGV